MAITSGKRQSLLDRDKGRCRYCGAPWHNIDHVIPRSKRGTDDLGNLVLACEWCNSYKKSKLCFDAGMVMLKPGTVLDNVEAGERRVMFICLAAMSPANRRFWMKQLGGYIPHKRDLTDRTHRIRRVAIVTGIGIEI